MIKARRSLGNGFTVVPVGAGETILQGTIVAIGTDGYAVTASKAEDLIVAGVTEETADNASGSDGDITVTVDRGTYLLENDGTIKGTDVLQKCYVADAVSVTKTAAGSSVAGIILAVKDEGVLVDMSPSPFLTEPEEATGQVTSNTP